MRRERGLVVNTIPTRHVVTICRAIRPADGPDASRSVRFFFWCDADIYLYIRAINGKRAAPGNVLELGKY